MSARNKNALILIAISFSVVLLVAGIIFMVSLLRSEKATVLHLSEIPTSAWKYMASNAPIAGRQGSEAIDYTRALAGGYGPEWRFLLQVDVAQVTEQPDGSHVFSGFTEEREMGMVLIYTDKPTRLEAGDTVWFFSRYMRTVPVTAIAIVSGRAAARAVPVFDAISCGELLAE